MLHPGKMVETSERQLSAVASFGAKVLDNLYPLQRALPGIFSNLVVQGASAGALTSLGAPSAWS